MKSTFNAHIVIGQTTLSITGATGFGMSIGGKVSARVPAKAPTGGKTIFSHSLIAADTLPQQEVEVAIHEIPEETSGKDS